MIEVITFNTHVTPSVDRSWLPEPTGNSGNVVHRKGAPSKLVKRCLNNNIFPIQSTFSLFQHAF